MLHYPGFKVEHIHGNRSLYMQANTLNYPSHVNSKMIKKNQLQDPENKLQYSKGLKLYGWQEGKNITLNLIILHKNEYPKNSLCICM